MHRLLLVALATASLVGCVVGDGPPRTGEPLPEARRAALRDTLSAAMAGHRVAPYAEAWDVLARASAVGPNAIRLFYTRRVVPAANRASGDNQSEPDFWNREHVWPQSYGLRGNAARTDLHNLVPVDRTVNSSRGNKPFDRADDVHHECALCRVSEAAWTPAPEVRGDVARIAFYMDVRYEGLDGDGTPDLVLDERSDARAARFGRLSTLMRWHCEDPVSDEERRRHEVVSRAQGNRNAFVDRPELAGEVYGFGCRR